MGTRKVVYRLNFSDLRKCKTGISIGCLDGYGKREFLSLGREPTDEDFRFLRKIYMAGKRDQQRELKNVLGI